MKEVKFTLENALRIVLVVVGGMQGGFVAFAMLQNEPVPAFSVGALFACAMMAAAWALVWMTGQPRRNRNSLNEK